ncbi:leucine-rich repeat domain-containing protein [Mesomycoplasma hyorhinis]|uniref:leucine-rich repeat domain-containing protein n=1 Tax=Mesomycoplasma hyorhinis TaxID=2100 RepID=UPI001F15E0DC|nr:leucine-rich repeat domain-containing protein [Mesomycoplasma hyorhinis]
MKKQVKYLLSTLVITTPIITLISCGSTASFSSQFLSGDQANIDKYIKINPTIEINGPNNTKTNYFSFTLDLSSTNLTEIPENAFYSAESRTYTKAGTGDQKNISVVYYLSKIIFPASLKTIEKRAFFLDPAIYNEQQRKLELDFSKATALTTIKKQAFKNNQISSLVLPNSLQSIEDEAFASSNIQKISFAIPQSNVELSKIGVGAFFNNQLTNLDLEKAKNLTSIAKAAFKKNKISSIKLPTEFINQLTINEEAFSENPIKKEDVVISDKDKVIFDASAFK